jgi:FkbM family methyltransferase
LIVSANGCTDNTRWYLDSLRHQFDSLGFGDHFTVVWHDQPLGFSKAVNAGIQVSVGQRILLLNNDVTLLDQPCNSWLDRLNAPFERDADVGITGTLKLFSKETGRDFLVFFCTMIDRKVIHRLGMLNEEYGVGGGEDIEYCIEAERAGFKIESVAKTRFDPKQNTNVSDFPIWHQAEGTMHDPQLVPNWNHIFKTNMEKLADKYAIPSVCNTHQEVAAKFDWLAHADEESKELFDEVIINNVYEASAAKLRNTAVIDVGANQGMFGILCAAMGAPQVISVEPVVSTHQTMIGNIERAGFGDVITTYQRAVTGKPADPVMISINQKSGHNSAYTRGEQGQLTETITLQQLMRDVVQPTVFLKMDCEGAEYDILFDSDPSLFDKITHVALEIHGDLHPKYHGVEVAQNRLTMLGYKLDNRKQIGMWYKDAAGNVTKFEPLPLTIEMWSR